MIQSFDGFRQNAEHFPVCHDLSKRFLDILWTCGLQKWSVAFVWYIPGKFIFGKIFETIFVYTYKESRYIWSSTGLLGWIKSVDQSATLQNRYWTFLKFAQTQVQQFFFNFESIYGYNNHTFLFDIFSKRKKNKFDFRMFVVKKDSLLFEIISSQNFWMYLKQHTHNIKIR